MTTTVHEPARPGARFAQHLTSTHQAVITTRCAEPACGWADQDRRWPQLHQDDAQAAVIAHVEETGHTVAQDVTVQVRTRPVRIVDTTGAVQL